MVRQGTRSGQEFPERDDVESSLEDAFFPWNLVERIGVYDAGIKAQVEAHLSKFPLLHQPPVEARRDFFF